MSAGCHPDLVSAVCNRVVAVKSAVRSAQRCLCTAPPGSRRINWNPSPRGSHHTLICSFADRCGLMNLTMVAGRIGSSRRRL